MNGALAHIWRHPVKGVGAEPLDQVELSEGRPLPLDRAWAILEQGGDETSGWRSCRNFLRGAKGPSLMAITACVSGDRLSLQHPDRPDFNLNLQQPDEAALFDWLGPIYPTHRQAPKRLVAAPPEGMADVSFASVSIMNLASLKAISQRAGRDLDMRRFRGNLWLNGLDIFEEFDLVGKTLRIGSAELEVIEPITRCRATEANPMTGVRDTNTLSILEEATGQQDFGVNAKVTTSGTISVGDTVNIA